MNRNRGITCCFTGHRRISDSPLLIYRTNLAIEECIASGYRHFETGGALGFDTLAALLVLKYKETTPDITLTLILPCRDQCNFWKKEDIARYKSILGRADNVEYIAPFYYDGCMQKRNRRLVDDSSVCIAYYLGRNGGTAQTVAYAREQQLTVINVAEDPARERQISFATDR